MIEYYDCLCACGCGQKIPIRPGHKYAGVPKYLKGHWAKSLDGRKKNSEVHSGQEISQERRDQTRRKLQKPREIRRCLQCGAEFSCRVTDKQKFCSQSCGTKYYWIHRDNTERCKKIGSALDRKIQVICQHCRKEFLVHAYRVANGEGKYCSQECFGIAHTGENAAAWNGGTSFLPYPPEFNDDLKEQIKRRDEYRCSICKLFIRDAIGEMCIHHIDYNKKNTDPNNLVLLCRSCHNQTNQNRDYWTHQFQNKGC